MLSTCQPTGFPRSLSRARQTLAFAVILLPLLLGVSRAAAAAPEVRRVDPPNWWARSTFNPVTLLLQGQSLSGAQVQSSSPALRAGNVRANASGTCLLVDITIATNASPGPHPLTLTNSAGSIVVPFDLVERASSGNRGFSADDVLYLIMPDRFSDGDAANNDPPVSKGLFDRSQPRYYHGGDFRGIVQRLDYLQELGVTALWLTPWYDNANQLNQFEKYTADNRVGPRGKPITDYHGYGAVDFYGVEEHFGARAALDELIEAARRRGMKIIQDQVPNHTGPYHAWVTNPPTPGWYHGTRQQHLANNWQTWTLTVSNAPADLRRATLEGWFIDILPDLNQDDPDCARYLIQNSLWWAGMTGIDGIRLDTLPYVPRRFWRDWRAAVRAEYPQLTVVGEMLDGDATRVSFFQGGQPRFDGVDSGIECLFDFPLHFAARRAFAEGGSLKELARVLDQDGLYTDAGRLVTFLGLHDVGRFMSDPGADAAGLKLGFTFLFTTRGIPLIYYGDEIAMRGGRDPDNRRDFPGGFPGDARDAFTAAGRAAEEGAVFEHVRRLARLRAEFEPLRNGKRADLAVGERTYAYARTSADGTAVVVLNSAAQAQTLSFPAAATGLKAGAVLPDRLGSDSRLRVEDGRVQLLVPPRSGLVFTAPRE